MRSMPVLESERLKIRPFPEPSWLQVVGFWKIGWPDQRRRFQIGQ